MHQRNNNRVHIQNNDIETGIKIDNSLNDIVINRNQKKEKKEKKNEEDKKDKKDNKICNCKESGLIFLSNFIIIASFATIYYIYGDIEKWNGISEDSNWFSFFYFSFTTMTTIGYGDISPNASDTKVLCLLQQLTVLFQIANFLSKVAIKKPFKIRLKKNNPDLPTISEKIGRQRRFNSCHMDYRSGLDISKSLRRSRSSNFNNNSVEKNRINIEEDSDEICITLPIPPKYF